MITHKPAAFDIDVTIYILLVRSIRYTRGETSQIRGVVTYTYNLENIYNYIVCMYIMLMINDNQVVPPARTYNSRILNPVLATAG